MSADKIRNIMTGEANVDSSHNLENFVKSVGEIDEKVQMVSVLDFQKLHFTHYIYIPWTVRRKIF